MDVSVCVTTYNHGPYIRQALDGVLAQELPFEWEVLIGEDDSTDGTRAIVREYADRHPDRVRVIFRDAPAGRLDAGRGNFLNTLTAARGRYVALLDGDDYWTSPHKLRKQVELLDRHAEYSGCFHNVRVLRDANPEADERYHAAPLPERLDFGHLAGAARNMIPTCSVVYRNDLLGKLPDWFHDVPVFGDWTLHLLNAERGPFGYIDEVLGVYRVHGPGNWSGLDDTTRLRAAIHGAKVLDRSFGYRHHEHFARSIHTWRLSLALSAAKKRRFAAAAIHAASAAYHSPADFARRATNAVGRVIRPFVPRA